MFSVRRSRRLGINNDTRDVKFKEVNSWNPTLQGRALQMYYHNLIFCNWNSQFPKREMLKNFWVDSGFLAKAMNVGVVLCRGQPKPFNCKMKLIKVLDRKFLKAYKNKGRNKNRLRLKRSSCYEYHSMKLVSLQSLHYNLYHYQLLTNWFIVYHQFLYYHYLSSCILSKPVQFAKLWLRLSWK